MIDLSEKLAAKDIEGRGLSKNDLTDDLLNRLNSTTLPYSSSGKNLIDADKTIFGSYYANSTGNITAINGSKRLPYIAVKPNTTYTLSGFETQFFGIEFDITGSRVQSIGTAVGIKSTITFTTSPTTVNVGLCIFNSSWDFTFGQLELGSEATTFVPFVNPEPTTSKESILRLSRALVGVRKNLIDASKSLSAYYFDSLTGLLTPFANANTRKCIPLIPVKGNTFYSLSGFSSSNYGNEYRSDGSFIRNFDNTGIVKTKFQWTTHPEAAFVGINAIATSATFSTAQLEEGPITDYESFVDIKSISNSISNSKCYYDFSVNTKTFRVFVQYGNSTDTYIGFSIQNEIDTSEIIYKNYYRINQAKQYRMVNGSMVDQSITLLTGGESEFVFQQSGKDDFTGGFHGDEQKTLANFFADGQPISDTESIQLKSCGEFWYIEKSTMHESATSSNPTAPIDGHPIIAYHSKRTIFRNSGYETYNEVLWNAAIVVNVIYFGICCITPATSCYTDEKLNITPLVQDGATKLQEIGSNSVNYYNANLKLGSKCISKVSRFFQNGTDNTTTINSEARQDVWDSTTYSKYYWRIVNKTTTIGDVWKGECKVQFLKNS